MFSRKGGTPRIYDLLEGVGLPTNNFSGWNFFYLCGVIIFFGGGYCKVCLHVLEEWDSGGVYQGVKKVVKMGKMYQSEG